LASVIGKGGASTGPSIGLDVRATVCDPQGSYGYKWINASMGIHLKTQLNRGINNNGNRPWVQLEPNPFFPINCSHSQTTTSVFVSRGFKLHDV